METRIGRFTPVSLSFLLHREGIQRSIFLGKIYTPPTLKLSRCCQTVSTALAHFTSCWHSFPTSFSRMSRLVSNAALKSSPSNMIWAWPSVTSLTRLTAALSSKLLSETNVHSGILTGSTCVNLATQRSRSRRPRKLKSRPTRLPTQNLAVENWWEPSSR